VSGLLIGIARRAASRAPMELVQSGLVSIASGLEGDCKGSKFPLRQITILAREDWDAALLDLGNPALDWTTRRANFLVEGLQLPRGKGSVISIAGCVFEVTDQTSPCALMDHFYLGLRKALAPDWRGGVTCKVLSGGLVTIGDAVTVTKEVIQQRVQLPG
jgi:MOSC domain-containing protein YiiM